MTERESRPGEEITEAAEQPESRAKESDTPTGYAAGVVKIRGYPDAQSVYLDLGWPGVLPLAPRSKTPPPAGFTGHDGDWPSEEILATWKRNYPSDANICLRLDGETVGVDVDAYGSKTGAQTLDEAERRWGALPPTVTSGSRDDGVSGIRLFRVPAGTMLRDRIKFDDLCIGDIEIIQRHHRYVVCWPSVHPNTGQQYVWRDPDGGVLPTPPSPCQLPELPEKWLAELSADSPRPAENLSGTNARAGVPTYDVTKAMTPGRPSDKVAQRLAKALYDLAQNHSRHDTVLGHVMALLRLGEQGEPGVGFALELLFDAFVSAVGPDRDGGAREAEAEFIRMVTNAGRLLDDGSTSTDSATRDDVQDETDFWAQRESLAHILAYSRARGVAPYAVLGAALRRAITFVPPIVQLPPTVGDNASLNLFTVSVGRSGQGKDAANGVGRHAVRFVNADGLLLDDPPSAVGIGSGEGLAKALRGTDDDESTPVSVNLEVPEIGTLGALADRKGATVIGELLKAYMGQPLGFTNSQKATTSFVAAHSYRLCLGVGAQPENADQFLSREKDGLPQRFLWLPTTDPHAPPPSDEPDEPVAAFTVALPTFRSFIPGSPCLVDIPAAVRAAIRQRRYQVLIGASHVDPLDGHLMLTRLKVSFGLALLDGRGDVSEDDWQIAGQLIEVSNHVRVNLQAAQAQGRTRANAARAHAEADRKVIFDDRLTQDQHRRVSDAIIRKLQRAGRATRRELKKAVTSTIRADFDAVFDVLLENGTVILCDDGEHYELVQT